MGGVTLPFFGSKTRTVKKGAGGFPPRSFLCFCQRSVALLFSRPPAARRLSAWQMAEPPPVCQSFYLTALKRRAGPLVPRVPGYLAAAVIKLGGEVRRLGERRTEPRGRTNERGRTPKEPPQALPGHYGTPKPKSPVLFGGPVLGVAAVRPGGGRQFGPLAYGKPGLKLAAGAGSVPACCSGGFRLGRPPCPGRAFSGVFRSLRGAGLTAGQCPAEKRKFPPQFILCVPQVFCVGAEHI